MDVESEHAARVCPSCDALAVAFDPLQGLSVCENCGRVVGDSLLVPHVFEGDDNRRAGVYVGPEDSGTMASAHLLQGTAAAKAIQSAPSKQPIFKSRQVLKSLCSKLDLPPAATEQAQVYLQTLSDKMAGGWSREHLAAGAAYASIRVNQLPLTLLDLASALQEDVVTLGRRYRDSIHLLGLHPPHMQASNLLDRAVGRVMPGSHAVPAVRQDAALVLQWMDAHLADKRRPLTTLGAAIVTACEMNNVSGAGGAEGWCSGSHFLLLLVLVACRAAGGRFFSSSQYVVVPRVCVPYEHSRQPLLCACCPKSLILAC